MIDTIPHQRTVATELFQELNHFRRLLFAQNSQLQVELLAELGELVLAPLRDKDQDDHVDLG